MGDVHADETAWHRGHAQVAAQGVHGILGPLLGFEALDPQRFHEVACVLVRQLQPPGECAALGDGPRGVRQHLAQRVPVLWRERHHQPPGPVLEQGIELDHEAGQHRAIAGVLDAFEEAVFPADHPAVSHAQQHSDSVVPVAHKADHVGVPRAYHLHCTRCLEPLEPLERITHLAGALEVLSPRRLQHGVAHQLPNVAGAALEELEHVAYHGTVVGLRLPAYAGSLAAAYVVIQAGSFPAFARDVVGAAAHRVQAADDGQGLPELAHVSEGTEVAGAGDVAPPGHQHTGKRLTQCDGYRGIALVVLQHRVEARPVLLDEVVLEDQRLGFVRHDDGLDVGNKTAEQRVLGAVAGVCVHVAANPRRQPLRLSDVQHSSLVILPEVDAGTVRQGRELPLERCSRVVHRRSRPSREWASFTPSTRVETRYVAP